MRYAIYEAQTGLILRTLSLPPSSDIAQQLQPGELWAEFNDGDDTTHYVRDGALVEYPARPSEFHTFDFAAQAWKDPRDLDALKAAQWELVKADRQQRDFGGFLWDGSRFDSDTLSQSRIQGAVISAMQNPDFTTEWRLQDNTLRTLDSQQMIAVGAALLTHVGTQFAIANQLRNAIESVDPTSPTAEADVKGVQWPQ